MLNTLRDNLKQRSWPKYLLLLVAASMTLYLAAFFGDGGGGGPDTPSGNWAIQIDGDSVPAQDFVKLARRIDQNYRQLFGQNYSQMQAQFRIGSQAMQQLLEQEIILRDARRMGLQVSDTELIETIRTAPGLTDASGAFIGRERYKDQLDRFYPGGVAGFESDMADEILIGKWTDVVSQSASVGEADVEEAYRQRNDKTAIDFVIVRSADQDIDNKFGDDEARTWYEQHPERYRRDEGRRVRVVTIERQARPDEIVLGEEEVVAAYQTNQAKYTHPEQRRARHILLRMDPEADEAQKAALRARAEDLLARVRGGEEFGALAREVSEDTFSAKRGGDLDWFGRGQMVPAFEEAAFSTTPGELAPVIETEFGFHVLQVTGARDAGTAPLEDVRDSILGELRVARAEEQMLAEAGRVRDKIADAAAFDAVAAEEGLEVQRRFVNESEGLRELGASNEFRTAVLAMEPGAVSAPLRVARGLAIVAVDEIVPPAVAPFEEVRERVRTDLLNARAAGAALEKGRNALADRKDFKAVAKALGAEVQQSGDLSPGQSVPGSGGASPEMRSALFGDTVEVGARGVVEVPAGALIYEVTRREPFDPAAYAEARESLRQELLQQRRFGMRRSIVDQLSRQMTIVINEPLVQQLDGGT